MTPINLLTSTAAPPPRRDTDQIIPKHLLKPLERTGWLGLLLSATLGAAAQQPRARDLGVRFDGTPGPLNAITDVHGVEIGTATIVRDNEHDAHGRPTPVRTGVTALFPRGKGDGTPVYAGWFSQNGNGEMTGTTWLDESGFLEGPVAITNTHSVGIVRDSIIRWQIDAHHTQQQQWSLPVVAETWDGYLNDINGFHVTAQDTFAALNAAKPGPVQEGSAGGGTGMVCYEFKGGNGTASRVLPADQGGYTVGVFVQCNCGRRPQLTVRGVPIGKLLPIAKPLYSRNNLSDQIAGGTGSIIIVVATDAPLIPTQLKRLARRATMGLARTGSTSGNGSGDIFLAFSTANPAAHNEPGPNTIQTVSNERISPLFDATVQATEEAIVNALVAGRNTIGMNGHRVEGLPLDRFTDLMKLQPAEQAIRFQEQP